MVNIASDKTSEKMLNELRVELQEYLVETQDPRALGKEPLWDYYPHYGKRINSNWEVDSMP